MRALLEPRGRIELARRLFGWIPHPTQRLWLEDEHKVKVAACGRRWGKTEAEAVDAATFAIAAPGSIQMIVSPTYDQSGLIFRTVERLLLSCSATRKITRSVKTPYPRLEIQGSLIMARTADEDGRNLRGHSAHRVIVDEAAYVRDAVIEEVITPMLADNDGDLILISTPCGRNHFYRAFAAGMTPGKQLTDQKRDGCGRGAQSEAESPAPTPHSLPGPDSAGCAHPLSHQRDVRIHPMHGSQDSRYSSYRFPSWENPHISRAFIEYQRSLLSERQFAVEYEAQFIDDEASVFPWADIEAAISLWRPAVAAANGCGYRTAGIDWARYSDFTVIAVIEAGFTPFHLVAIDRFNAISWERQVERAADFLAAHRVNAVLADQTSIGDPLLEQLRSALWRRQADAHVEGRVFTASSKRELIDNLVLRLAHRELALPFEPQLIRELEHFASEFTSAGNIRLGAEPGHTDDCVIALALACWQARNAAWSRSFLSSGSRRSGPGFPGD